MSRYALSEPFPFEEVEFGWDPPTGFFLQCSDPDKDGPTVWLVRLNIDELADALQLHVAFDLPDLARRALAADARDGHTSFVEGDPVLWRGPGGTTRRCAVVTPTPTMPLVRFEDGKESMVLGHELEPDLPSLGID